MRPFRAESGLAAAAVVAPAFPLAPLAQDAIKASARAAAKADAILADLRE
jgi:hypothetical protein